MTLSIAMPSRRRGQKLAYSFDEDEITLAWDAVRAAGLAPGTKVAVAGFTLSHWFWQGTGLVHDPSAPITLEPISTTVGPSVVIRSNASAVDIEVEARRLHQSRRERPEPEWQKHRVAREGPDTEADFPLGAYVLASRHDEVVAQRMRWPDGGQVVSWTSIGPGAAPTEFARLQDAVGAYYVVLVAAANQHTVGIWAGDEAPHTGQRVAPVLRRLFRTQGAWRHGVKFASASP